MYVPSPGIVPPHLNPSPIPKHGATPLDFIVTRPTSHGDNPVERDGYGRMRVEDVRRRAWFRLEREALR